MPIFGSVKIANFSSPSPLRPAPFPPPPRPAPSPSPLRLRPLPPHPALSTHIRAQPPHARPVPLPSAPTPGLLPFRLWPLRPHAFPPPADAPRLAPSPTPAPGHLPPCPSAPLRLAPSPHARGVVVVHRALPRLGRRGGPDLIVDDGDDATLLIHKGVKAEGFEKTEKVPDPESKDNPEFKIVLLQMRVRVFRTGPPPHRPRSLHQPRSRREMAQIRLTVSAFLLLAVVEAAAATRSPSAYVQNAIYSNRIAIFSKTYCPLKTTHSLISSTLKRLFHMASTSDQNVDKQSAYYLEEHSSSDTTNKPINPPEKKKTQHVAARFTNQQIIQTYRMQPICFCYRAFVQTLPVLQNPFFVNCYTRLWPSFVCTPYLYNQFRGDIRLANL